MLPQTYKEPTLKILTQEFSDQEPRINFYWRQFPQQGKFGKENYVLVLVYVCLKFQILAQKQGFQYAFVYATNFKTGIAVSKLDYYKISLIDCRQYEYFGVKPFCFIDELNRKPSIWMKKLH